ncbi:Acyl transferase domain-containing protein [Actinomadura madurae]|uniref:Acyl transferase domain-containing protein n=1 Tax=Actinomadura madurae TaxID=1993 RepID=A0A1I5IEB0_9ACTN|nr:type I polyketide synthase [Actinomadura madurae]SFO58832.1 Acyl transferase domain-containing protein [Actinomadura madurae]
MGRPDPIAIIGMAGRFPAANDIHEFRDNVFAGRDCLTTLSADELRAHGVDQERLDAPDYVRRRPLLDEADSFDAGYFGLTRREAQIRDPQHRLFLETAHAALEHAGYDSTTYDGHIGLYAGANVNRYRYDHVDRRPDLVDMVGDAAVDLGNFPDYLATFTAYRLGLRGPSMTVLTACSTSLVCVHEACKSIRAGDCEMAIAGGVDVEFPVGRGYFPIPGGILARDGVCRPFDESASGTNFGSGVGAVLLKPLPAAIADRDTVYAVIRGSGINNDGDRKVGFAAPSIAGQSECIQRALRTAEVDPRTISYVEAHGTATPVGDPIEIAGLVDAFRAVGGDDLPHQYCAIGSVKSNIGHLGQAAGVAGLIKTVLALHHRRIPASVNVDAVTTRVDWARSPFAVATKTVPWPAEDGWPRRAAVSSFGFGGTNAHLVLEEAPPAQAPARDRRSTEVILWSAVDEAVLDRQRGRLAAYFDSLAERDFPDAAHSLRVGRTAKPVRAALLAADAGDAAAGLRNRARVLRPDGVGRRVAFAFPGPDAPRPAAFRDLYASEPSFRAGADAAFDVLEPLLDIDLRALWAKGDAAALAEPVAALPLLYVLEYTLANCLIHWGVRPDVLFGHGFGEFVAGAVAGVLDFEPGLRAVAALARLTEDAPRGEALMVAAGPEEVLAAVTGGVAVTAVNAPRQVEISGPADAIAAAADRLTANHVPTRRLHRAHAMRGPAMAGVARRWPAMLAELGPNPPRLPVVSGTSGSEITAEQAASAEFWARLLVDPVDFDAAAAEVLGAGPATVVEVGPDRTLGALLGQRGDLRRRRSRVLQFTGTGGGEHTDLDGVLVRLWLDGEPVGYWRHLGRRGYRRIAAPGYPYDRRRFWVDVPIDPDG